MGKKMANRPLKRNDEQIKKRKAQKGRNFFTFSITGSIIIKK